MFDKVFNVKTLNGTNGFAINEIYMHANLGISVSSGDVNGDGISDMVVKGNGGIYVIFGQKNFSASYNVTVLDGTNGFKIPTINDSAVTNFVGDMNGDGLDDIVLFGAFDSKNTVYVIFGQKNFPPLLNLSMLNSTMGFRISHPNIGLNSVTIAGDINNDEINDLVISRNESLYIIFGQRNYPIEINLENMNETMGVTIPELYKDIGRTMSAAGDINDDGIDDLMLGAKYQGKSVGGSIVYVIFGQKNFPSQFNLTDLNGTNGFIISGSSADVLGYSLSSGDINGDGINDVVIGDPYSYEPIGAAYVIFGQKDFSAQFNLTSLNGINGFIISSEFFLGNIGRALSNKAGDINNDKKSDLVLSLGERGPIIYVVFGSDSFSSHFYLNTLDGVNGFTVPFQLDATGIYFPSTAGDINDDGIDDLVIGCRLCRTNVYWAGTAYAIFGKDTTIPQLNNNHLLALQGRTVLLKESNINATDIHTPHPSLLIIPTNITHGQFEYVDQPNIGISNFTQHNISASMVQFRADKSYIAPSYSLSVRNKRNVTVGPFPAKIIFHDVPRLINNQLTVREGQLVMISSSNLKGIETYTPLEKLWFSISEIQHGKFQVIMNVSNQSVLEVTEFSQQDVTNSKIQFVHDGSENAPNYAVVVKDTELSSGEPQYAKIDFKANPPVLHSNNLLALQGKSVALTTANLNATSSNNMPSPHLLIVTSNVQHGYFEYSSQSEVSVNNFTQYNISNSAVYFRVDNSGISPSYEILVKNSWGMTIGPYSAKITFHDAPRLIKNELTIQEGHSVLLTSDHLQATEDYTPSKNLIFSISNLQHGRFQMMLNESLLEVTEFYQNNLTDAKVQFKHDGSDIAPSYAVTVRDSELSSGPPSEAKINFIFNPPQLHQNKLLALQGKSVVLTEDNINATDTHTSNTDILIITSNVQHGQFEYVKQPETSIKNFTQHDISTSAVQFRTDNSYIAPSYDIVVKNRNNMTVGPYSAKIIFHDSPLLIKNKLTIREGQTVVLSSHDLQATEKYTPEENLIFSVDKIQHGVFQLITDHNITSNVTEFFQKNITDHKIQFVHDGSEFPPNYSIFVRDNILSSGVSKNAEIDFKLNPAVDNTSKIAFGVLGGLAVVSAMSALGFFAYKEHKRTEKTNEIQDRILESPAVMNPSKDEIEKLLENTEDKKISWSCQLF